MTGRFHCSITGFSEVDRLYQSADRCSPLPIHARPPVATADGQAPQHAAAAFRDFATPSCRWWFRNRDRKSVVSGKSVSVRVDLGGCCIIIKKNCSTSYRQSIYTSILLLI